MAELFKAPRIVLANRKPFNKMLQTGECMIVRYLAGFFVAFFLGAFCRYVKIPSPAPQALLGSLLVVTVTLGYMAMDHFLANR